MACSVFRTQCSLVTCGKSAQEKRHRPQHDQTRGATACRNTNAFVQRGKANENKLLKGSTHSLREAIRGTVRTYGTQHRYLAFWKEENSKMCFTSRVLSIQLHRPESSLKSQQLLGQSRNPCILWNPKAHYCALNWSPLTFNLSQINDIHTLPFHFRKIHFNIIHSSTPRSSKWTPSFHFTTIPCMHF